MKKIISLFLAIAMISMFSVTALADDLPSTNRGLYGPTYSYVGTAYLTDTSKDAYLLLSVSSSPDVTGEILEGLNLFCSAVDALQLSNFIPGCNFVNIADKFYQYTGKGMTVNVLYEDAVTGERIWADKLADGDYMRLGCDHPNGYKIYIKNDGLKSLMPWVKLFMVDNVTWTN